jgi:hypothetical protein
MIHHDERDYEVAVGETAKRFQAKLDDAIHASQASALSIIDKVQRETPTDRIAHSQSLRFAVQEVDKKPRILMTLANRKAKGFFQEPLHKHALEQIAERAGVPVLYLNRLLERPYGAELIVENLSRIFKEEDDKKYLVRSVNDEVRGVLSDAYRRMDSAPIIEAFAKACGEIGAVPIEGTGGDLRWAVKAILPKVFQPASKAGNEELIAFGVQLSNSDFGRGTLSLNAFTTRVICTNHATLEQVMKEVHLGKRLSEDLEFSKETYLSDTKTQVLAVADMVRGVLAPNKVNMLVGKIGEALDARIDPKAAWAELPKLGLLKGEVEKVKELFNDAGVEQLPPGTSPARLSNAISWFAKSAATPERKLELEQLAGQLLIKPIALREAA